MNNSSEFVARHVGPNDFQIKDMLGQLGLSSLDELVGRTVPADIRMGRAVDLPPALSERELIDELRTIAGENQVFRSYIGMGYSGCVVPPVILRNVLENPAWYTQYTPYQSEISQGRLEALLNFQTMIADLTGLPVANASLLDEATAAAEAMAFSFSLKGAASGANGKDVFFVASDCHPQVKAVVRTRAEALGVRVVEGPVEGFAAPAGLFGALFQYPSTSGLVHPATVIESFVSRVHAADGLVAVAADLLSLVLLKSPGEWGADVAVGSAQRFGVPMGFGGPHAAYFATKDEFKRRVPGRIVGVSKDVEGKPALRLALQTREQHIRRDKATSNICTAQVLLAIMASMYAVYHGPRGLRRIAERVHRQHARARNRLRKLGFEVRRGVFFDTVQVEGDAATLGKVCGELEARGINVRRVDPGVLCVAVDETLETRDLGDLLDAFGLGRKHGLSAVELVRAAVPAISGPLARVSSILGHPVFNQYHSETEMLRYIHRLEQRDLSLAVSMIPLGSCTMKLNATAEMIPVTWRELGEMHPFAPEAQTRGYRKLFKQLETMLAELTGLPAVSLQPNAGSQGEYTGLLVIRAYHQARGQGGRNVCLIPKSAHGTNPATAAMAGMEVVAVECDPKGNVDLMDLEAKVAANREKLAALMVTYPSTHGVFEGAIRKICDIVHGGGGQVYMDGANLNAQIGLCRPGDFGPDVIHINLHKTFAIPHGGGGPGMGPICVKEHLAEFLPGHPVVQGVGGKSAIGSVSAAPWGSASILPISWAYIRLLGAEGATRATQVAILNANYIAHRLNQYYPVLYRGEGGFVAHECIVDLRHLKATTGVEVEDVAKRLMDYGFHAPTVSFPVAGTMMIEPTESESKDELDRFCDAMIAIHAEIQEIGAGRADRANNLLKNAPHTVAAIAADTWSRPYSRERAVFPLPWVRERKFWPAVARVDNVYGDRNLICSCPPMEG